VWDFIEDEKETRAIGLGIQVFMGMVGLFTLIVAGVGVANIMYVVVKERTQEIGIKLALGARRFHVMAQFLFEAVAIAVSAASWASPSPPCRRRGRLPKATGALRPRPVVSWPSWSSSHLVAVGLWRASSRPRRSGGPVESLIRVGMEGGGRSASRAGFRDRPARRPDMAA
jgi:hypothetical protein